MEEIWWSNFFHNFYRGKEMKFHALNKEKENILKGIPTPSYVLDEENLIKNLKRLKKIQDSTGAKILLAQKCFSTTALYPLIAQYLWGTVASGIFEARLAHEEFCGDGTRRLENHVFEPAYKTKDIAELNEICDNIIFNSWNQFQKHKESCTNLSIGIRINPECSTQSAEHAIYDPCAPGSRLGIRLEDMPQNLPPEIEGFHMHTLCEQQFGDLLTTFKAFEKKFGKYLHQLKWLNLGGGHYIAHDEYDVEQLIDLLNYIRATYNLQVYLEPGEGVVLNAGYIVTEIMDKVHNGLDILILDTSAACHFPDVIEGPYLPPVYGAYELPNGNALLDKEITAMVTKEHPYIYRLSSMTCLAGDVIGDYGFDSPFKIGDKLIIQDMAIYSIVKNNTFNGMPLPDIRLLHTDGRVEVLKQFGYEDFKYRLA